MRIKLQISIDKNVAKEGMCVAICRLFYHSAIPFNATQSPYFTFHKLNSICRIIFLLNYIIILIVFLLRFRTMLQLGMITE